MAELATKSLTSDQLRDLWWLRYGHRWAPLADFRQFLGNPSAIAFSYSPQFEHHLLQETMQHMLRIKEK